MSADPWEAGSLPTCYRHPDRETRLACSSCGRPACLECVQSAAVGQKCAECAPPEEGERRVSPPTGRGRLRSAPATFTILGLAVAVWILAFVAPELGGLIFRFGVQDNAAVARGEWYRLFTAAFLHSPGPAHILFNMLALYLFGPPLEREAGSVPFTALYFAAALAGGAAFFVLNPPLLDGGGGPRAVGASGAIFGLLGAWLAASVRNRRTAAGQAYLRNLLLILGINLVLPFVPGVGDRIAWEAHVGGLVGGFVIALGWFSVRSNESAATLRTLVAAAVGVAALFLVAV